MAKARRLIRLALFIAISAVGWLLVWYFEVPDYIVILVLLVAVYLRHEVMFERLSGDLGAVESFLDERFPDEACFMGTDPTLRRDF